MSEATPSVICFGEILWDFLPCGLFPGGAPPHVAWATIVVDEADLPHPPAISRRPETT